MRYRKKPVVIEASQWHQMGDHPQVVPYAGNPRFADIDQDRGRPSIRTLEGDIHWVTPGDWIIKGVEGEFYACNPDIFAKTYEPESALPEAPRIEIKPLGLVKMLKDQRDEVATVLRELVYLKTLKDGFGEEPFGSHNARPMRAEYERRQPLAWQAARAILAKCPDHEQQLRNICSGLGLTREELQAALDSVPSPLRQKPCATCNDDPAVCATVPGLRHCEAATRDKS